jgi:hypothetical protein
MYLFAHMATRTSLLPAPAVAQHSSVRPSLLRPPQQEHALWPADLSSRAHVLQASETELNHVRSVEANLEPRRPLMRASAAQQFIDDLHDTIDALESASPADIEARSVWSVLKLFLFHTHHTSHL